MRALRDAGRGGQTALAAFRLAGDFPPRGDQPQAIERLVADLKAGRRHNTLLGVTGSGKTFTMANVIARMGRPALVIAPNKTLAAQLYSEFRALFPDNAVEYFVSYYDYYQPEAYVPASDTYIEKDARINDEIDRMRHSATRSLLERNDVIIVATVSCIYGLGSAEAYYDLIVFLEEGGRADRDAILRKLVEIQYDRSDYDFHRGTFRVRGDVIEVFPASEEEKAIRIELWGDEVEALSEIDPLRGKVLRRLPRVAIYPSSHYVTTRENLRRALRDIEDELRERLAELTARGKLLEAERLRQRTLFDLEMLEQTGRCAGIENYSRHLTGRAPGQPPPCLLDYFPRDYLLFLDESHVTVPQLGAMFRGDRSRKETLVEYGFRLPSALDNRPLRFDEFEALVGQVVYVSATPGDHEIERSGGRQNVVEQIIRPTGLVDPAVEVRPARDQVDDLLGEVRKRTEAGERVLVTTLTKRLAEDLTDYLREAGVRVRYLHSDIDTLERVAILRDLRLGAFDVLVGINLLREGLDIPEVSLVAILDADKEGFLRSHRSLIQTIGRAARNVNGRAILYADHVTESMRLAIEETERRRARQLAYNEAHGITPRTVRKAIRDFDPASGESDWVTCPTDLDADFLAVADAGGKDPGDGRQGEPEGPEGLAATAARAASAARATRGPGAPLDPRRIPALIAELEKEMLRHARALEFEEAARIRDRIFALRRLELEVR